MKSKTTKASRKPHYPPRLKVKAHSQRKGHTCGADAVFALLRFHEWEVPFDDVTAMLGTGFMLPVMPGRAQIEARMRQRGLDWRGTGATDVCNILWRYRFTTRLMPGAYLDFRQALRQQIEAGNPVLAATEYAPGTLHWILFTGITPQGVWVADSLYSSGPIEWSHHQVKKEMLLAFSATPQDGYLAPAILRGIKSDARLLTAIAKPYVESMAREAARKTLDKIQDLKTKGKRSS